MWRSILGDAALGFLLGAAALAGWGGSFLLSPVSGLLP